jgi:hypothetical protein
LEKKGARLNVLLSDCCNVRGDGFAHFAPGIRPEPPSRPTPLFGSLFLKPSGWVDLNASSPGEAAFFRNLPAAGLDRLGTHELPGSMFTSALTGFLQRRRELPLSWHDLVRELSVDVHLAFRTNYPHGAAPAKGLATQTAQHVYAITCPGMPDKFGPRTGLTVRNFESKGALISQITAGSAAARAYEVVRRQYVELRPGEIIIKANDTPIQSGAEFTDVVAKSPQLMRLLIRRGGSGASAEYLLTLRY